MSKANSVSNRVKHAISRVKEVIEAAANNHMVVVANGLVQDAESTIHMVEQGELRRVDVMFSEQGALAIRLLRDLTDGKDVMGAVNELPRPVVVNGKPVV